MNRQEKLREDIKTIVIEVAQPAISDWDSSSRTPKIDMAIEKLLALLDKELQANGYVKLAKDQTLPEFPIYDVVRKHLIKAGWRKVE